MRRRDSKNARRSPDEGEGRLRGERKASRARRVRHSLVAVGSAAVLTIYSAGFLKTRAAAQRFAAEDAVRRPPAEERSAARIGEAASRPGSDPATPRDGAVAAPAVESPVETTASAARDSSRVERAAQANHARRPPVEAPAVPSRLEPSAHETVVAEAALPGTVKPAPDAPAKAPPVPLPVDTVVSVDSAAAFPDSTTTAAVQLSQYRDGTYTGWGTSRHGDIQASVVIEGGRIVSASITQCLTRYSCSWISALPPQVVSRQSPEVDYISGATQSTNAFYYAVVEALAKAR